ncbi:M23 family metallopeptidase [Actinomadura parmotrematis]|uniref:M23 family metallopeptidase n=1 Tax=Actinomadura parmotrematis TaxID=2864039 RepID=A0ABS7G0W1_9ACTN|nr:M23 family metallopeptidase [Actinomadura parmotrematis]MBW8486025.1 M23 family metallopeptidase [Actinomadura parmotrematis]
MPDVVRVFAPPIAPWAPGHRGVDLAGRAGQPVYAAGSGQVSYAGRLAGRGVVAITHGRLRTTYLPVRPAVGVGREVAAGTRIGVLEGAAPPHCGAPCLHWGLRKGASYLDPLTLVRPEVRLLPWWAGDPAGARSQEGGVSGSTPRLVAPGADASSAVDQVTDPAAAQVAERTVRKGDPAREGDEPPRMGLRDATAASGGALLGMAVAFVAAFLWRRPGVRGRKAWHPPVPPGVIDLARERSARRAR